MDRSRSRSPYRNEENIRRRSPHSKLPSKTRDSTYDIPLPFGAKEITKHDLPAYRLMFALFLDIKKHLDIDDLDESEVKGRWKSFVGKWNRGELSEGWYDPQTLEKATRGSQADNRPSNITHVSDEEDEYGPTLPSQTPSSYENQPLEKGSGPTIPSIQDLQARREQASEDAAAEHEQYVEDIRRERRSERKVEKERLDELAPRAEPGTRERQLEKKREKADSNRVFAASKDGGDVELRDSDVMGDEDSLAALKRMQKESEKKRTEREIRREETLRARRAEREERLAGLKEKEDKTMAMLKEIAQARFGSG